MSEGIDLARQRIAEEAVARTGTLDLGRLGSTSLPGELFELDHLRALNLGQAFLSEDGIWYDVDTELAPNSFDSSLSHLGQLPDLHALYLLGLELASLESIQDVTNIQVLYFDGSSLSDLTPLQSMEGLRELSCHSNVDDLTPPKRLSKIRELHCSNTQVGDLTPLEGLTDLQELLCINTQVGDLMPLKSLNNVRHIAVDKCVIEAWPKSLWHKKCLESVFASGALLAGIPSDLFPANVIGDCLPAIRAHLNDLGDNPETLNDVKLIVLGNGRIGKTQIVNRLRGEPFEADADSTHGVSLVQAPIPGAPEKNSTFGISVGRTFILGPICSFSGPVPCSC